MMDALKCDFVVEANPVGKGRPRAFRVGTGVRMHTPPKTKAYEQTIAFAAKLAMRGQPLLSGPVSAVMTFSLPIPPSWSLRKALEASLGQTLPTVAPDLDNLAKAVLDGCNGVVFEDDKQVVTLYITKRYAQAGRVAVSFEEIRT